MPTVFNLNGKRMEDLIKGLEIFWETLKKNINSFIENS
jgi:hypothetical protein